VVAVSASVLLDHDGLWAVCHRYPDRPPILFVSTGGASITLTVPRDAQSQAADELARAVAQYAAALVDWQQRQVPCCEQPAVSR